MRAILEMTLKRAAASYVSATRADLSAEQWAWYLASRAALHRLVQDVLSGVEPEESGWASEPSPDYEPD